MEVWGGAVQPPKTNMEPEHGPLEKEILRFLLETIISRFQPLIFWGVFKEVVLMVQKSGDQQLRER